MLAFRSLRGAGRRSMRSQAGTVLPVILAVGVGVGALTAGFALRTIRATERTVLTGDREEAMFEALAQIELVSRLLRASPYDGGGSNLAIQAALARADGQFIDADGWPTGVVVSQVVGSGGPVAGMYELVSTATTNGFERRVTAIVSEHQSFADFNMFVESHPLGIAGGTVATFPYTDAPEGAIHSNDALQFYFPDRHFRDGVSAVNGFSYVAGAQGPLSGTQNNFFHGPSNPSSQHIHGLLDVDIASFAGRPDSLLALTGTHDLAKIKLLRDTVEVEHWTEGRYELQDVTVSVPITHTETVVTMVPEYEEIIAMVAVEQPVYALQSVWVEEWTPIYATELQNQMVETQVWVATDGSGAVAGGGAGTGPGYWETQWVEQEVEVQVVTGYDDTSHFEDQMVDTGTTETVYVETSTWVETGNTIEQSTEVEVIDGYEDVVQQQNVWVPPALVATHTLGTDGTIYCAGNIEFVPVESADHGADVHVLDGQLTVVAGNDIFIDDSIVYGHLDGSGVDAVDDLVGGVLETAYLNGDDHSQSYEPNPDYTGDSVLGLIAGSDIEYRSSMPTSAEINATLMAKSGNVRVEGTTVDADGTIGTPGVGFLRESLRRLGGLISNMRPITSYVDSSNAITHGFIRAKTVYDRSQRTTPPIGFPSVHRPVEIARVLSEVR